MPTLYNPLHKFNSYSIHYVMIASRTTESARIFMDGNNNAESLEAISKVTKLGESIPYGDPDSSFLVIDTRRFSQFTVNRMKYEILINGVEQNKSHGNLVTSLTMEVLDSVGISFINFMQYLLNEKMQTNYDGMIFMLRIIFVGHNPDGSTEVVQTETIPMHLFDMKLALDHTKGAYEIEFMPNMNFDGQTHSRWLNIAATTSFATKPGSNKLGDMVNSLEDTLNEASKKYYDENTKSLSNAGATANQFGKFGRLVKYMITIPKEWQDLTYTGSGTMNATETVFKNAESDAKSANQNANAKDTSSPGANKPAANANDTVPPSIRQQIATPAKTTNSSVSVANGTTITQALDTILGQVKEIAGLGQGKNDTQDSTISFYKYITGVSSTNEAVTVHVDVVPFKVPKVEIQPAAANQIDAGVDDFYQTVDGKRVPKNYAEYDYIFTGKNVDILNFDLKIQDLQWLIASNISSGPGTFANGSDTNATQNNGAVSGKGNSAVKFSRPYDAMLPPMNTGAELDNFSRYDSNISRDKEGELVKTTQDYARNLSMFYAATPIIANMTIKGNPDIMTKFNMKSFLPQGTSGSSSSSGNKVGSSAGEMSKDEYREEFERTILNKNQAGSGNASLSRNDDGSFTAKTLGTGSYTQSPVFVKVNINGPNVDFATNDTIRGEDFSKAIIQDNYYVVMKVINNIEGSNFTQDLELYSHNVFNNGKVANSTQQPQQVK